MKKSKALWSAKIRLQIVAKDIRNKTKSCNKITSALSEDLPIRLKPKETRKTRKNNKIENKISVITLTKSFPVGKAQASDLVDIVSCSVFGTTLSPTFAN